MDAKAEPAAVCHLVVVTAQPAGDAAAAWLPPPAPDWRLPLVTLASSGWYPDDAEAIRQASAAKWALYGHVLCHLQSLESRDGGQREQVAVMEALPDSLPADWRPMTLAGLIGQPLDVPQHLKLLAKWLSTAQPDARPAQRVAWAVPGWRARAEAWIGQEAERLGLALAGPIAARKVFSISCVLQVPTSGGDYYFKAVPPLFGREPALTDALARRHPGRVPEVVALDVAEGWMLMRGFSGTLLREWDDLAVWQAAVRAYAELQVAWRADLDALRRLGCPDRGPLRLAEQIDDLLADEALMRLDQPRGLTEAQLDELRVLAPRLKAACAEWQAAGVPLTLEHGDYHAGNVAVNAGRCIIFDWTDGCIGHPFVCLAALMENVKPEWREPVSRAFLEPWRDLASPSQMETALRLSRVLGPLHMAFSYYDIHHAAEPLMQWQLDGGGPYFLRELLKYQEYLPVR